MMTLVDCICSVVNARAAHASTGVGEAVSELRKAYLDTSHRVGFERAMTLYDIARRKADELRRASEVLHCVVAAGAKHCEGEMHFFSSEYPLAADSFRAACHHVEAVGRMCEESVFRSNPEIVQLVARYRDYYEIETLEAEGFALRERRLWLDALRVHEAEIDLTKTVAALPPCAEKHLNDFFQGHLWYAEASRLRTLAELARERGHEDEFNKKIAQAATAEAMSVRLNPQWGYGDDPNDA
jgi:hypothetical protein